MTSVTFPTTGSDTDHDGKDDTWVTRTVRGSDPYASDPGDYTDVVTRDTDGDGSVDEVETTIVNKRGADINGDGQPDAESHTTIDRNGDRQPDEQTWTQVASGSPISTPDGSTLYGGERRTQTDSDGDGAVDAQTRTISGASSDSPRGYPEGGLDITDHDDDGDGDVDRRVWEHWERDELGNRRPTEAAEQDVPDGERPIYPEMPDAGHASVDAEPAADAVAAGNGFTPIDFGAGAVEVPAAPLLAGDAAAQSIGPAAHAEGSVSFDAPTFAIGEPQASLADAEFAADAFDFSVEEPHSFTMEDDDVDTAMG